MAYAENLFNKKPVLKQNLQLTVKVGKLPPKELRIIVNGMLMHHAKKGHTRKSELVSIILKNEKQDVLGGIIFTILWNGMEINTLWVHESIRNKGWGRKLLHTAEHEGKIRGCTLAYTNTFSWQAPEFYLKMGYIVFGELKNFPVSASLTYLYKKLSSI